MRIRLRAPLLRLPVGGSRPFHEGDGGVGGFLDNTQGLLGQIRAPEDPDIAAVSGAGQYAFKFGSGIFGDKHGDLKFLFGKFQRGPGIVRQRTGSAVGDQNKGNGIADFRVLFPAQGNPVRLGKNIIGADGRHGIPPL